MKSTLARVVPVHSVGDTRDATRARVHLEREPGAGRSGRAEDESSAPALGRPHDARAEKEDPSKLCGVQYEGRRAGTGQHGHRGRVRLGQVARQQQRRQRPGVALQLWWVGLGVVGLEVVADPRVVDGYVPVAVGGV